MPLMAKQIRRWITAVNVLALLGMPLFCVLAAADQTASDNTGDTSLKQEIDTLNGQVKNKESHVNELDSTIAKYKQKIAENESAVASLTNQVALLDNRIKEKQLDVERTKEEINIANLQIQSLAHQIELQEATIKRREDSLAEYVRQLQEADSVSVLDVFIARPSLSQFFTRLEEMKRIESDLTDATHSIKESKNQLEITKQDQEKRRTDLENQKKILEQEQLALETDKSAKISLVSLTQSRESEFQRVIYELRAEQQSVSDEISSLRDALKDKLDSVDVALARGDILLNWPIPVLKGISAHFHDPSYPFRRFFEHPGVDIPTDVGTPIHAAAGGYVAWNKVGKQYGNYVMLIHPGGIATVYGHLSRFVAKADTYVERGEIIGYSGGMPGTAGAGLSTGPHVHFEVRQNGIPVNPENFLPGID